jgi:uridylate kinase
MADRNLAHKRILLKLSGEALAGDADVGIDPKVLSRLALEIGQLVGIGVQIGIVVGGGNLFRGAALQAAGLDRVAGDHMGMLATVMNGIAMRDALERNNIKTRLMSAIPMSGVVDHYDRRAAVRHLQTGRCADFCGRHRQSFLSRRIQRPACAALKSMLTWCSRQPRWMASTTRIRSRTLRPSNTTP